MRITIKSLSLLPILVCISTAHAAVLTLADNGISTYTIYYSPGAPDSIKLAANELQHYLKRSAGITLPISSSDKILAKPLVSLGDNKAAQHAGISTGNISAGGYRIITRGKNLYILGDDTANGEKTPQGGDSTGTLNGVYTFLEDYLGIRWLMPGEIGEYVPQQLALKMPVTDRIEEPGFACRQLVYVQNEDPQVKEWLRRQKQGCSAVYNHGHNWTETIPATLYSKHPDWFAMLGGFRPAPVGRYKLETTNPRLVQEFSNRAIAALKNNPQQYSYSISPSDGENWSTSPESRRYYDKDLHGHLSVTPLILDFYDKVAHAVARQLPDRLVCGYIYAGYLYPPSRGMPKLASNLCLVIAPSINYGYGLYRTQTQQDFETLIHAWTAVTAHLGYYDLPVTFQQSIGAPNPPGLEILAWLYPRVHKAGVKKVYIYGVSSWGHGAITNYLLARLNWNPNADVAAIAREFYSLTYGDNAGAVMAQFYNVIEQSTKKYHQGHDGANYWLSLQAIKGIYLPVYPELEKLFIQARQEISDSRQEERLKLLQMNMALFRKYLLLHKLVEVNPDSPFIINQQEVVSYLNSAKQDISFAVDPATLHKQLPPLEKLTVKKITSSIVANSENHDYLLRGKSRFAFFSEKPSHVQVRFANVTLAEDWAWYVIRDSAGHIVAEGDIGEGNIASYLAKANEIYLMDVIADSARYRLDVKGTGYAISTGMQENGIHLYKKLPNVYIYLPENDMGLTLTVTNSNINKPIQANVNVSDSKMIAKINTNHHLSDKITIRSEQLPAGIVKIDWDTVRQDSINDVWLKVQNDGNSWVALNMRDMIIVSPE